jgi:FKBP-type peptidyl-prolyl cis-trans isomerase
MEALKGKDYGKSPMKFPDYETTATGLQYKDLRKGSGPALTDGNSFVMDWQGYTIGYYGRIFEARNKARSPYATHPQIVHKMMIITGSSRPMTTR